LALITKYAARSKSLFPALRKAQSSKQCSSTVAKILRLSNISQRQRKRRLRHGVRVFVSGGVCSTVVHSISIHQVEYLQVEYL